jgi:hypothetical protein
MKKLIITAALAFAVIDGTVALSGITSVAACPTSSDCG